MDKDKHNLKRLKIITLQTKEFDMNLKEIYFAGGCFWGTEHYMSLIKGALPSTTSHFSMSCLAQQAFHCIPFGYSTLPVYGWMEGVEHFKGLQNVSC